MAIPEQDTHAPVTITGQDVLEWFSHQSWRCTHPDRYPQSIEDGCPCGLIEDLQRLKVPQSIIEVFVMKEPK